MSARRRIIRPRFEYDIFGNQTLKEKECEKTNGPEEKKNRIVRPNFLDEQVKIENGENVELLEVGESPSNILRTEKGDFILIEASKLSLDDEFMQYEPLSGLERWFKNLLCEVIKKGIRDFYRPIYDPSFNKDRTSVIFESGKRPAIGKSYNWWEKVASEFMPERHSRLGTKSEYVAFLGVLIKKLITNGWGVPEAWYAVCNDSKELGHYRNSEDAKPYLEDTGMRGICGFFDLANIYKILTKDDDDCNGVFWLAVGNYSDFSDYNPLVHLIRSTICGTIGIHSVGWFVLSA